MIRSEEGSAGGRAWMQYHRGEMQYVYIHHEYAIQEAGTIAIITSSGMSSQVKRSSPGY